MSNDNAIIDIIISMGLDGIMVYGLDLTILKVVSYLLTQLKIDESILK